MKEALKEATTIMPHCTPRSFSLLYCYFFAVFSFCVSVVPHSENYGAVFLLVESVIVICSFRTVSLVELHCHPLSLVEQTGSVLKPCAGGFTVNRTTTTTQQQHKCVQVCARTRSALLHYTAADAHGPSLDLTSHGPWPDLPRVPCPFGPTAPIPPGRYWQMR